jgi:hypothetical protein
MWIVVYKCESITKFIINVYLKTDKLRLTFVNYCLQLLYIHVVSQMKTVVNEVIRKL